MRVFAVFAVCTGCVWSVAGADELGEQRLQNWHQWRGPHGNGVAPQADPPVKWDESTNIKWKIEVPGLGNATPVIWQDQVIILTAIETDREGQPAATTESPDEAASSQPPTSDGRGERERDSNRERDRERAGSRDQDGNRERAGEGGRRRRGRRSGRRSPPPSKIYQFVVMSIDRETGGVNWTRVANEQVPHEGFRAGDNSFASGSPITDGRFIYASFGSFGISCYDLEGNLVWQRDLGDMQTRNAFGEGATPALYQDWLIVNWDHEGQSFIAVLDARTGETKWKVDRDEKTSWATPFVVDTGSRTQVIVNATNRVRSYALDNGDLLWECGGQTTNTIPSPVLSEGNVICMSGFRGSAVYAIPLDSAGDLTNTGKAAWYHDRSTDYRPGTPYVPSPLLYGDLLYFLSSNNAILSCLSAKTGEVLFDKQRLAGLRSVYASPVGAADKIYIVGRDGTTAVLQRGPQFEQIATNELDDDIDASPAVVGKEIFLRGKKHLYCIARK